MSFTALNGEDMELPFAEHEPIDSTGVTLTSESPTSKIKEEPNDVSKTPVTPQKRSHGKKQPSTDPEAETNDNDEGSPTKRSRKPPGKKMTVLGPVPASYEEASPEDRMILRMKETEGKGWGEIQKAIEEVTGSNFVGSTLRVRYMKLKANFVVFEREDESHLLQGKKELEEKWEHDKWQKIAEYVEMKGGNKYPAAAIQKKFKELSK
ncbi:uncharacterized protein EURHEDRAFT_374756 [Aspergillus ruber CBS 135680]|uniref:Uncharacterized protein n=1 Tax=Aspergillus ruber (strain CBS 135680) TaxID=1388766 RepID=A0A017SR03_ASPRC|nr:uncharacterized protein EURHEDRAFT_374756 [Aspergillus ruber CBS 135680]EYE98700.1 hypothetical protein EURHEDRAFT_374756 [Aspergillus ruber CBS 135680]